MSIKIFARISWLTAVTLFLASPVIFGKTKALLIFASYWNSEANIGMWMAQGFSAFAAFRIATLLGNFSVVNYWTLAYYKPTSPRGIWVKSAINNLLMAHMPNLSWCDRWPAILIYIAGLIPSAFCFGILFAQVRNYNRWATIALILAGNTSKNALFWIAFVLAGKVDLLKKHMMYVSLAFWAFVIVKLVLKALSPKKMRRVSAAPAPQTCFE